MKKKNLTTELLFALLFIVTSIIIAILSLNHSINYHYDKELSEIYEIVSWIFIAISAFSLGVFINIANKLT
jgi:hypothetical protein